MTAYKGVNTTKYDAGGSGDNIIADGYIKTVEKVWMDSFSLISGTEITTSDTIAIASIPPNKKITGVEVTFPNFDPTTCTIRVGTESDADAFISEAATVRAIGVDGAVAEINNVSMDTNTLQTLTTSTTNTTIYLAIGVIELATTSGTIYTKVSYT